MDEFEIDYDAVFRVIPPPKKETINKEWAGEMFSLADEDYLCYWLFSHATRGPVGYRRIALYHLSQAIEKYLKCMYMARLGDLPKDLLVHDLGKLLGHCSSIDPSLESPTLRRFCIGLDNVVALARYPDPKRPDAGFIRFTADVDRVLQGIRELAKVAVDNPAKQLIERVLDKDLEWNPDPAAGWLTEAGVSLGEAARQALVSAHPGSDPRPQIAEATTRLDKRQQTGALRIVAIDWSGARKGAEKKIWLAEASGGRLRTLESGRSRDEIAAHLVELAERDSKLIIGLDFAFSLPRWFLAERGLTTAHELWDLCSREGETWLASCEPPFWGRPGKRNPRLAEDHQFRQTDLSVPAQGGLRPKSVFQIGGAGAVGTGSLRGMPILRRLHDAGLSIWPFDSPSLPMVVEIWPRLMTGPVTKSSSQERANYLRARFPGLEEQHFARAVASDDAFDAAVSALMMDQHGGELMMLPEVDDLQMSLEGMIYYPGVYGPRVSLQTP